MGKGYKAFNSNWTCRGYQYEVGKTYDHAGEIGLCEAGFHFCRNLIDVYNYYRFNPDTKIAEIEFDDELVIHGNDNKSVTSKITIIREIPFEDLGKEAPDNFAINSKDWKEFKNTKILVWNSKIIAWGNSSVVAYGNSSVVARGNSSVEANENSSVEANGNSCVVAWENSSVEANENSSVVAKENSSVVAWENSSVVAKENSSVVACGNSCVVAWENSSVVACGNSSVVARGNSSVEANENSSVEACGNSSVVIPCSTSVKIKSIHDYATVKDLSGDNPVIHVATDFEIRKFTK